MSKNLGKTSPFTHFYSPLYFRYLLSFYRAHLFNSFSTFSRRFISFSASSNFK